MRQGLFIIAIVGLTCSLALAGRYEDFTKKAAKGPHAKVVAATFFGTPGVEEFVAAVETDDDRVLAFGNAWGPQPIGDQSTDVWGRGRHSGAAATTKDRKGRIRLNTDSPDRAGFVVAFDADLRKVKQTWRFNWGVATIEDAVRQPDGKVIIAGRGGPHARSVNAAADHAYVAHIDDRGIRWITPLKTEGAANKLWTDDKGRIYTRVYTKKQVKDKKGRNRTRTMTQMWRMNADGSDAKMLKEYTYGAVDFQGVNPKTGEFYFGGDRNTHTGKEPWRQPYMYVLSPEGEKKQTIWAWPSKKLRTKGYPAYGQVSDSSVRGVNFHPKTGHIVVNGWSDGGNSVFTHQPTDISERTGKPANGYSTWGMKNANSLAYIMRIDPQTWKMQSWSYWVSYVPMDYHGKRYRGAPNFCQIEDLVFLENGCIAFAGRAATGLIQTPNAFFKYKNDGEKHGGQYVALQSPDQKDLLFSSYMTGCKDVRLAPGSDNRLIVVSRSSGEYDHPSGPYPTPTKNAVQDRCLGQFDAHIMLLATPKQ